MSLKKANYVFNVHRRIWKLRSKFISSATACFCIEIGSFLKNKAQNALGMLVFDEQKEYYTHVERSIKILRLDKGSLLKTSNLIEKGFFVDSKKSYALQLSDLVAYYIRKYEESKLGIKVSELDKQVFPTLEKLIVPGEYSRNKDVFNWIKQTWI